MRTLSSPSVSTWKTGSGRDWFSVNQTDLQRKEKMRNLLLLLLHLWEGEPVVPEGGERGEGGGEMLNEVPPQVEDGEGGAETDVRGEAGDDVVPHREHTQLLQTGQLCGETLQAVVAQVQVVKTPEFSNVRGQGHQAVVVEGEFLQAVTESQGGREPLQSVVAQLEDGETVGLEHLARH